MSVQPAERDALSAFYDQIDGDSLVPLWVVLGRQMTNEPVTPVKPHIWRYEKVKPHLLQSGALITAKQADRRVLVLKNPGLDGAPLITQSLQSGLQLILPGEIAPAHRHTQAALRFIFEGRGAYTAVDGERTIMQPGDFVITPNWCWHDHGNESSEPMIWLDGLDVGLVMKLGTIFAEHYPQDRLPVTRSTDDSLARFSGALMPVDDKPARRSSPVINYPYERTRTILDKLSDGPVDACHGIKLKYANPVTGEHAMPTLGAFIQLLPKGFCGEAYRSTDATVFAVVEGHGCTVIGGERFAWAPHDVFVVPTWAVHHHEASSEAVLFSFSDRPAQEKLELWREWRAVA